MRNHNSKKTNGKLSLSKETLRQLTPKQLQGIAGGVPTEGCTGTCGSGAPLGNATHPGGPTGPSGPGGISNTRGN